MLRTSRKIAWGFAAMLAAAGPAFSAGSKNDCGATPPPCPHTIVDDLTTGGAESVGLSAGIYNVSGALGQVASTQPAGGGLPTQSFGGYFSYTFQRLLVLMPGENAAPGTFSGKVGGMVGISTANPVNIRVQLTDQDWYLDPNASDNVLLTTTTATGTSLPTQVAAVAGVSAFNNVLFSSTIAQEILVASDLSNLTVFAGKSTPFQVFGVGSSSPTINISIPLNSTKFTLGGGLSGFATDPSAVAYVKAAIQQKFQGQSNGAFWDWANSTFSLNTPQFATATLTAANTPATNWLVPFPDGNLLNQTSYYVIAIATDPSNNAAVVETTFTFSTAALVVGSLGDGQGSAYVSTNSAASCSVIQSSIVFTVGSAGITPGGFIAVHVPSGWTPPYGFSLNNPVNPASMAPPQTGFVNVVATGAAPGVILNPPSLSSATLGTGWIVVQAVPPVGFKPGQIIDFIYNGFAAGGGSAAGGASAAPGAASVGPQFFSVMTQGGAGGNLKPIALSPLVNLTAGAPASLSFSPVSQLSLGALQTSPTMQIQVTDQCGASTTTAAALPVALSAGNFGAPLDAGASFYAAGGAAALSPAQVTIPMGASNSSGFYFNTSNPSANTFEFMFASATFSSGTFMASRYIQLFNSNIKISNVSIDTGTLTPSQTAATMPSNAFLSPVVINFNLNQAGLIWEVIISSDGANFYPEVVHRYGNTDPGRSVSWNGINERVYPHQAVTPGVYYVKIRVAGGVATDTSLSVTVPQTASIYGTVNSTGASALVSASGPSANYGNFAVASSTGFFQIFGLQPGVAYNITATSATFIGGVYTPLTVSSYNVVAAAAGVDIGTNPFPTPGLLRVSVSIPNVASRDIFGGINLHNANFTQTAFGSLHFSSGSSSSDNGAQNFGSAPSTWSLIAYSPGTYSVDINLPQIGLSTTIPSVTLYPGANTDQVFNFVKKANVYGFAILPTTTTYGTFVSVQAAKNGSQLPTVFGGTFIGGQVPGANPTQGLYGLFGLDPGSWTVSARAVGFNSVSSNVYISSSADVGTAAGGGFDLSFSTGGVIIGTITVLGDTTKLADPQPGLPGFDAFLNAYNPVTFGRSTVRVRVLTNSVVTSSTFSISGLDPGQNIVQAHIDGYTDLSQSVIVGTTAAQANLSMKANSAGLALTINLPGTSVPPTEFAKVALYRVGPGITPTLSQNVVALGQSVQYFTTSATIQSPPLGSGVYRFDAYYPPTGAFVFGAIGLTQGATAALTLDLTGSTYSVSGQVNMTGSVSFSSSAYSVTVSSVPGLLAYSMTTGYCLLGSGATPTMISAAHMELLPILNNSGIPSNASLPIAPAAGCASMTFSVVGNAADPSLGYVTPINSDGTFSFAGVPAGNYILRDNATLTPTSSSPDIPQVSKVISVGSNVSNLAVTISAGSAISGNLILPSQVVDSRPFAVSLFDSLGNRVRSTVVSFNNANTAAYSFSKIPDGSYAVVVNDLGVPKIYSSKPLVVKVLGLDVSGQDVQFYRGGVIHGTIGIQQLLPDGTTGPFTLITSQNTFLLPRSFTVTALANPWFQGGRTTAQTACPGGGGGGFCPILIDGNNQFEINDVLPGTYDLSFQSSNNFADGAGGGVNLVSTLIPGVKVSDGQLTDVGTVNLNVAAQIRGVVTDVTTSTPLANIPVSAIPSIHNAVTHDTPFALTDQNGNFVLNGLDPKIRYYDVIGASPAPNPDGPKATVPYEQKILNSVDLSSGGLLSLALTPAPYTISGQVAAPPGGPALTLPFGNAGLTTPGALVFVQKAGVVPTLTPIADLNVTTDRNGKFSIAGLTAGTYKLLIAAVNYGALSTGVTITNSSVNLGTLNMGFGGILSGNITKANGSAPSQDEVQAIYGVSRTAGDLLFGTLTKDQNTNTVTGYSISGFKISASTAPIPYRLILVDGHGNFHAPDEANNLVFTSTAPRSLDLVFRVPKPLIISKGRRVGTNFQIEFDMSQALRNKTTSDADLTTVLTTVSAQGTLSQFQLSADRTKVQALYTPGVSESSFTVKINGYSAVTDPKSVDPVNPEFQLYSQATFYIGIDGLNQSNISNFQGGDMFVEGNTGRVTLPTSAFSVDPSSSVQVTLQISADTLSKIGVSRASYHTAQEGNLASLRYSPSAYPSDILRAMAATPPTVSPFSGFYNILLPLGIRTALQNPVPMTIAYSSSTDPTTLNMYWYNAAANAYIRQVDVTGAPPVIDKVNHTLTINVNHFSTFVLFNTGIDVITGDSFAGTDILVYNFPNPFDLSVKTVTAIHNQGNVAQTVRGTMVSISVPSGVSDNASLRIFNVAGERVRTMDMGFITGGSTFYQPWDGRNDSGHDCANGVYLGEVKIGSRTRFFKMALIK